jgi:hypothetical protein
MMVGEMALVEHRPRRRSWRRRPHLVAFDNRHFKQLLEEMPKANDA